MPSKRTPWMWVLFWFTLALRLFWAWRIPITGDEAYYVTWGLSPALGYYDHPPMIGWMLALLVPISLNRLWLRLPIVLLFHAISLWIRKKDGKWSDASLIWIIAPLDLFFIFIGPDVPLVLCLTGFFWLWSREQNLKSALFAGLFLGGALLSKYFAWFIVPMVVVSLIWKHISKPLENLPSSRLTWVSLLVAAPAVLFHVLWNSQHSWVNWVFNAHSRMSAGGPVPVLDQIGHFLFSILLSLVLTAPILPSLKRNWKISPHLWTVSALGFAMLILTSFRISVSVHYFLPFLVPLMIWYSRVPESKQGLRKIFFFYGGLSILAAVAFTVVLAMPLSTWKSHPRYREFVWFTEADRLVQDLEKLIRDRGGNWILASDNYTSASMVEAARGKPVIVMGSLSVFGRQDDYRTDLREYEGKSFLIFTQFDLPEVQYETYFDKARRENFYIQDQLFYVWFAEGFRFKKYEAQILNEMRRVKWVLDTAKSVR